MRVTVIPKKGGWGARRYFIPIFLNDIEKSQVHTSFLKQKMVALIEKKMISETAISRLKNVFYM